MSTTGPADAGQQRRGCLDRVCEVMNGGFHHGGWHHGGSSPNQLQIERLPGRRAGH